MGNFGAPLPGNAKSAQEKWLEERSKTTEKIRYDITSPKIIVMDLATEEGRTEYERIVREVLPLAMADRDRWFFKEFSSPMMIDPNAKAGYRIIHTVRCWQIEETKVPGNHGFSIVDSGIRRQ